MFEYFNGFWRWASENNDKNTPNITAMYFYLLRLNNELGWVDTFQITSTHSMHNLGIGAFKTYKSTFDKLEEFGLIEVTERAKNQFSCNRIRMVKFTKALLKAPTKASTEHSAEHSSKQVHSTVHSTVESTSHIHKTKDLKDYTDFIDGEEKKIEPTRTLQIAWFKKIDKEGLRQKVLSEFGQHYPSDFLEYFIDYYSQDSENGGIHINTEYKFSLEAKLKQFWSDPKTKARYQQTKQLLPDEITSKPNEELAERIARAKRYISTVNAQNSEQGD